MKIIYPNNIVLVSASSENASFPATNLQTEYVGEKWKGTTNSATLTIFVSEGDVVALFGTNALTATVYVTQYGENIEWESGVAWATGMQWVQAGETPTTVYDLSSSSVGSLWAEYGYRGGHYVVLTLTADAGEIIEAGVVVAGVLVEIRDPAYGIQTSFEDYSTIKQLNSGARYIDKGNIARTFNFQVIAQRDTDFYSFMYNVYLLLGPKPAAYRIVDNDQEDDWEWVVYAAMLTPPVGKHITRNFSNIQIALTEMV